jgi:hypothetical protein
VAPRKVVVAYDFGVGRSHGLNRRTVRVNRQTTSLTTNLRAVTSARLVARIIENFLSINAELVVAPALATELRTRNGETSFGASRGTHLDSVGRGIIGHGGQGTRA